MTPRPADTTDIWLILGALGALAIATLLHGAALARLRADIDFSKFVSEIRTGEPQ